MLTRQGDRLSALTAYLKVAAVLTQNNRAHGSANVILLCILEQDGLPFTISALSPAFKSE
jgi:hypothetical protein